MRTKGMVLGLAAVAALAVGGASAYTAGLGAGSGALADSGTAAFGSLIVHANGGTVTGVHYVFDAPTQTLLTSVTVDVLGDSTASPSPLTVGVTESTLAAPGTPVNPATCVQTGALTTGANPSTPYVCDLTSEPGGGWLGSTFGTLNVAIVTN
jgi:hypothetical protein